MPRFTEEVLGQSSNASMPGDGPAAASSPVELGMTQSFDPFPPFSNVLFHLEALIATLVIYGNSRVNKLAQFER